jgi:hypothetical protein
MGDPRGKRLSITAIGSPPFIIVDSNGQIRKTASSNNFNVIMKLYSMLFKSLYKGAVIASFES